MLEKFSFPSVFVAVLFGIAVAVATSGSPETAIAGFCWPAWYNNVKQPCPPNSVGDGSGCKECSGNGVTIGLCQESNWAWDFCYNDICCKGISDDGYGSACHCVPRSYGACACTG